MLQLLQVWWNHQAVYQIQILCRPKHLCLFGGLTKQ